MKICVNAVIGCVTSWAHTLKREQRLYSSPAVVQVAAVISVHAVGKSCSKAVISRSSILSSHREHLRDSLPTAIQVGAWVRVHSAAWLCPNAPCVSVAIVCEHLVHISTLVLAVVQVAAVPLVHVPVGVLCPNAASPGKPHTEQGAPAVVQSRPVLCEV